MRLALLHDMIVNMITNALKYLSTVNTCILPNSGYMNKAIEYEIVLFSFLLIAEHETGIIKLHDIIVNMITNALKYLQHMHTF